VRPQVNISTVEVCPTCNGSGTIAASIAIPDMIQNNLDYIINKQNEKKLTIILHPFIYSYFTAGFPSMRMKWFFKYKRWISLAKDSSFALTEFRFVNEQGIEIETSSIPITA
jgi:ribonuclease G